MKSLSVLVTNNRDIQSSTKLTNLNYMYSSNNFLMVWLSVHVIST